MRYAALRVAQRAGFRTLVVKMDTNWLCNLRCRMCYFSDPGQRSRRQPEMDMELFRKIAADVFPRAYSVALSCGAEPLMSKQFVDFLEVSGKYGVPHLTYCTNGLLLSDDVMAASFEHGVTEVIFSVDAATRETYEFIRPGGDFGLFREKLARFVELRGGRRRPEFRFNVVAMQCNVDELPDVINLAGAHGVATVQVRHVALCENMDPPFERASLAFAPERFDKAMDEVRRRARMHGIRLIAPAKFCEVTPAGTRRRRRWECINPWFAVYIMPNGDYRPCIWLPAQGNFRTETLDEILANARMRQVMKRLSRSPEESCLAVCDGKRGVLHSAETDGVASLVEKKGAAAARLNLYGWE